MRPLVSLAMIALVKDNDARRVMRRAIASVLGVFDEIVLVLDDRTPPEMVIACIEDCGWLPRVTTATQRFESFSRQRKIAQEICAGEWVLVLDADDVFAGVGNLRACMESAADEVDAIFGEHRSVDENGVLIETSRYPIAYRRSRCTWKWREHSQLLGVRVAVDSTAVVRKTYRSEDLPAKARRAIPLLMRDLEDAPNDAHAPFFLARSFWMIRDTENAELWARRATEIAPADRGFSGAWALLAWATLFRHGVDRATKVVEDGLVHHGLMPDLLHVAAFLAAARWMNASQSPANPYRVTAQNSPKYLPALVANAQRLGWPIAPAKAPACPS